MMYILAGALLLLEGRGSRQNMARQAKRLHIKIANQQTRNHLKAAQGMDITHAFSAPHRPSKGLRRERHSDFSDLALSSGRAHKARGTQNALKHRVDECACSSRLRRCSKIVCLGSLVCSFVCAGGICSVVGRLQGQQAKNDSSMHI